MDPAVFYPILQHFSQDKLQPRAILLEYLPNTKRLNCVNYSDTLYAQAIKGIEEIHRAGVHHRDIYPRNILLDLASGSPDKLIWIYFDVATIFTDFGPEQLAQCDYEIALVRGLGEALARTLLLPMLEVVLTDECREMTRPRDSYLIQNSIEGSIGLQKLRQYLAAFTVRSCNGYELPRWAEL